MKLLSCLLLTAALACQMFGQAAAGNITGTVVDASGAAVPKAKVDLLNLQTGVSNTTTTDSSGVYRVSNLLIGNYTLTVNAPGFTNKTLKDIAIELNKTTTANVSVEVGGVATSLEVVDAAALDDLGFLADIADQRRQPAAQSRPPFLRHSVSLPCKGGFQTHPYFARSSFSRWMISVASRK